MTQETEDVVELADDLRSIARLRLENPDLAIEWKAADRLQSLSDRLAVQDDLLRRAQRLIRPYCAADEELRAFSDELTVAVVEGKE